MYDRLVFFSCVCVLWIDCVRVPVKPNEESLRVLVKDPDLGAHEIKLFKDLNPSLIVRRQDELVEDAMKNIEEQAGIHDEQKEKIMRNYLEQLRRIGESSFSDIRDKNLDFYRQRHDENSGEKEEDTGKQESKKISKSEQTFENYYAEPLPERTTIKKKVKKEAEDSVEDLGKYYEGPPKRKSKKESGRPEENIETTTSYHEDPGEVPTRVNYPGRGQWARRGVTHKPHITIHQHLYPENINKNGEFEILDRNKNIYDEEREGYYSNLKKYAEDNSDGTDHEEEPQDFIPFRTYSQVRRSNVERKIPKKYNKTKKDKRLKEIQKNSKAHTVYTEEGYEDSAYDHGGSEKKGDKVEKDRRILEEDEEKKEELKPDVPQQPLYDDNEEDESERDETLSQDDFEPEKEVNGRRARKSEESRSDDNRKTNQRQQETEPEGKAKQQIKPSKHEQSQDQKKTIQSEELKGNDKEPQPIVTREGEPSRYFTFENEDWFQKYRFDNINDYFTFPPDEVDIKPVVDKIKEEIKEVPKSTSKVESTKSENGEALRKVPIKVSIEPIPNTNATISPEEISKTVKVTEKPLAELSTSPRNIIQVKLIGEERLRKIQEKRKSNLNQSLQSTRPISNITKRKASIPTDIPTEQVKKTLVNDYYLPNPVVFEYYDPRSSIPQYDENIRILYPIIKNVEKNHPDINHRNDKLTNVYKTSGDQHLILSDYEETTKKSQLDLHPKIDRQYENTQQYIHNPLTYNNDERNEDVHEDVNKFQERATIKRKQNEENKFIPVKPIQTLDDNPITPLRNDEKRNQKITNEKILYKRPEETNQKVRVEERNIPHSDLIKNPDESYLRHLYQNKEIPKHTGEETIRRDVEPKGIAEEEYIATEANHDTRESLDKIGNENLQSKTNIQQKLDTLIYKNNENKDNSKQYITKDVVKDGRFQPVIIINNEKQYATIQPPNEESLRTFTLNGEDKNIDLKNQENDEYKKSNNETNNDNSEFKTNGETEGFGRLTLENIQIKYPELQIQDERNLKEEDLQSQKRKLSEEKIVPQIAKESEKLEKIEYPINQLQKPAAFNNSEQNETAQKEGHIPVLVESTEKNVLKFQQQETPDKENKNNKNVQDKTQYPLNYVNTYYKNDPNIKHRTPLFFENVGGIYPTYFRNNGDEIIYVPRSEGNYEKNQYRNEDLEKLRSNQNNQPRGFTLQDFSPILIENLKNPNINQHLRERENKNGQINQFYPRELENTQIDNADILQNNENKQNLEISTFNSSTDPQESTPENDKKENFREIKYPLAVDEIRPEINEEKVKNHQKVNNKYSEDASEETENFTINPYYKIQNRVSKQGSIREEKLKSPTKSRGSVKFNSGNTNYERTEDSEENYPQIFLENRENWRKSYENLKNSKIQNFGKNIKNFPQTRQGLENTPYDDTQEKPYDKININKDATQDKLKIYSKIRENPIQQTNNNPEAKGLSPKIRQEEDESKQIRPNNFSTNYPIVYLKPYPALIFEVKQREFPKIQYQNQDLPVSNFQERGVAYPARIQDSDQRNKSISPEIEEERKSTIFRNERTYPAKPHDNNNYQANQNIEQDDYKEYSRSKPPINNKKIENVKIIQESAINKPNEGDSDLQMPYSTNLQNNPSKPYSNIQQEIVYPNYPKIFYTNEDNLRKNPIQQITTTPWREDNYQRRQYSLQENNKPYISRRTDHDQAIATKLISNNNEKQTFTEADSRELSSEESRAYSREESTESSIEDSREDSKEVSDENSKQNSEEDLRRDIKRDSKEGETSREGIYSRNKNEENTRGNKKFKDNEIAEKQVYPSKIDTSKRRTHQRVNSINERNSQTNVLYPSRLPEAQPLHRRKGISDKTYEKQNSNDETEDDIIGVVMGEETFGQKLRRRRSVEKEYLKQEITEKYPNYYSKNLDKTSSFRYAENPESIVKKTKNEMVLYDRTEEVECPELEDIDPIPEKVKNPKNETTKSNNTNYDPKTRIKGKLSDQIDCLKKRYFGDNPFDNPLFEEEYDEPVSSSVFDEGRTGRANEKNSGIPKAEGYVMRRRVVRRKPQKPTIRGNFGRRPPQRYGKRPLQLDENNDRQKYFSEVHYKEEIKPSEQLNVFADVINNIKNSNEDVQSSESEKEEIYIKRKPSNINHRYRRYRTTTSKPFLPTPIPTERTKKIPINILPEHKDADEIIIVKKPPRYRPKKRDEELDKENFVSEETNVDKHPMNKFYYVGLRPPPKHPYNHPNFYNPDLQKQGSSLPKRKRIKRSRGYAEIKRSKNETDEEIDDYVPHRQRNFHYDEKTGQIVYDKKDKGKEEETEYDYVEMEEPTHPPPKKKEEPKRFPPTPPPGPSYIDYIKILKNHPNYTIIEDPKPAEKEEMTENVVTSSETSSVVNSNTGLPEYLSILSKVKADKSYKIYLDPTPKTKSKKKIEESDNKSYEEVKDTDEDVGEIQNSPGVQGVLDFNSHTRASDTSDFTLKPKDYSPKTSIDTSKYTTIRRNPVRNDKVEEKTFSGNSATVTAAPQRHTIDVPTISAKPTTPIEEDSEAARQEVKTRRTIRRRPAPSLEITTISTTLKSTQRRQRGRSRYRSTTPSSRGEETVRSRRNLQRKNYEIPRNHRRDYTKSKNEVEMFKPTPRSITLKLINQTDIEKLINDSKSGSANPEDEYTREDFDSGNKHGGNYKYKKVQIKITRNYKPGEGDEEDKKIEEGFNPSEFYSDPKLAERINTLKEKNNYEFTETFFQEEDNPEEGELDEEISEKFEVTTNRLPNIIKDPSKRLYFYAPI